MVSPGAGAAREGFAGHYGPWAVIVGASAGIGAAAADEAARRGLNVLTVARRAPLLEEGAARIRSAHGVEVRTLAVDLLAPGATAAIVAATEDLEVGTFVYNAAAEPRGYFLEVPVAEHLDNITVNCTVPTVLTHHFAAPMATRRRGAIVLVSSMGALQGGKVFTSYFAAKAYEWILAEGLWAELAEVGVHAFAYMVGATRTENYKGQIDGSSDQGGQVPADRDGAGAGRDQGSGSEDEEDGGIDLARRRLRRPSDPDDVGRHLFAVIGRGPTEFSHPDDARHAVSVLQLGRGEAVTKMSDLTTGIRRR
jgi:short-subunit dehydrogenase